MASTLQIHRRLKKLRNQRNRNRKIKQSPLSFLLQLPVEPLVNRQLKKIWLSSLLSFKILPLNAYLPRKLRLKFSQQTPIPTLAMKRNSHLARLQRRPSDGRPFDSTPVKLHKRRRSEVLLAEMLVVTWT